MDKKFILVSLVCLLSNCMVSCSNVENLDSGSDIDKTQTKWESVELDDNLVADFYVEEKLPDITYSYNVERTNMPIEKIQELFFYYDTSEKQITRQYTIPENIAYGYTYNMISDNGLQIFTNCEGSKGMTQEAEWYRHFLGYIPSGWDDNGNPNKLGTDEEISFLDKKQIQEEIEAGLAYLQPGIDVTNIRFYSLTGTYLNEIQDIAMNKIEQYKDQAWYEEEKENCREWNDESSAYYITVEMSIGNIPIKNKLNFGLANGQQLRGYSATFIYNKNGCVFADIPELLQVKQSQEESIISVSQALDTLKRDITSVILTDENVIENAKLQYVLVYVSSSTELEILPMWVFEGKVLIETNKGDLGVMEVYENYFVNAITGEVLH